MPGRSFRIARIAGIPVGVSPWWLVIVALITWSLGAGYYPGQVHGITPLAAYGLGLASVLLLFASILAHEFGHALVARHHGMRVEEIDLWLLGGVARMSGEPNTAGDELRYALAGPAVTALVAMLFVAVALVLPGSSPAALRALVRYQASINLLILAFNLAPAFPLDGGRVTRALLWRRRGDITTATATAAALGRAFGFVLIALGLLTALSGAPSGLWFAVIGVFLVLAASAEGAHQQLVSAVTGIRAGELMSRPAVTIPARLTLALAEPYFGSYRYTAFPVVDDAGAVLGILTLAALEQTPSRRRAAVGVGEHADRDPALVIDEREDVGRLLEQPAFGRVGRAVVIDRNRHPIGVISVTDIQRAIRVARLGTPRRHAAGSRS